MNTHDIHRDAVLDVADTLRKHGLVVQEGHGNSEADLLVSNHGAASPRELRVRYQKTGVGPGLNKSEVERWTAANPILVFLVAEGENRGTWYIPLDEFKNLAKDPNREDDKVYITISESRREIERFEDDNGIDALKKS